MAASNLFKRLVRAIWGDWQSNTLWQRIVKYSIACAGAAIIAILPRFKANSTFLTPMVVVFAHPGQRTGVMVESLLMIMFGSLLGLSWSLLGLYCSGLVLNANPPAAYAIRALFLLVCVLLHGFVRSSSPRLFNFVLFLLIAALLTIQLPSSAMTSLFTTIYVPILLGGGVSVLANLAIFPELSCSFLGSSTIHDLSVTTDSLIRATYWFITPGSHHSQALHRSHALTATVSRRSNGASVTQVKAMDKIRAMAQSFLAEFPNPFRAGPSPSNSSNLPLQSTKLEHLVLQKSKLRSQLARGKKAQTEINYEISLSALPPTAMKPISVRHMEGLVLNIIRLIGACENKFLLVDGGRDLTGLSGTKTSIIQPRVSNHATSDSSAAKKEPQEGEQMDKIRPVKEMEAGSYELLEMILQRIRSPTEDLQTAVKQAVDLLISCLAYCFDVSKLPSGSPAPRGIRLEEIDLRIDDFSNSISLFDQLSTGELKRAIMDETGQAVDFMPRMETFLTSSFMLAFHDSANLVLHMLRHARDLVEKRQRRHDKFCIWVPQFRNFRKWLATGGETDGMVLPEEAKKAARQGRQTASAEEQDEQETEITETDYPPLTEDQASLPEKHVARQAQTVKRPSSHSQWTRKQKDSEPKGLACSFRAHVANAIEWVQHSDDVDYSLKLAMAVFLVTWPAFVGSWNDWYTSVKGVWAPMQLILVFEVAIGTSLFVFAVRLFGVVFGCTVGLLCVEIGRGSRVAAVVILCVGIVPSVYVQIATKYVKAGMISIVSMAVIALGAVNNISTASDIFYKRLIAFLVGGLVAIGIEALVRPVRARDRLVESLSSSVRQIQRMQAAVAVGIDDPLKPHFRSQKLSGRFRYCCDKARGALAAADTFLPFCLTEPRLKGSFRPLEPVYQEIIYVLQQIIDRMENVVHLRMVYGSFMLEETLNSQVHTFRRSVAASCTLMLFSVNEALTTWLPLPQFLPSARLAQLRLINRVREILTAQNSAGGAKAGLSLSECVGDKPSVLDEKIADMITQRNFLSWNASTTGQIEIIEYLEELVELVKLLVGVHGIDVLGPVAHEAYMQRPAATEPRPEEPRQEYGEAGHAEDDGLEGTFLPRSLTRVGTRLMSSHTVVRRRGFTITS